MTITTGIHGVTSVRATRAYPSNGNSVTITIEAKGMDIDQTVYFGDGPDAASKAMALFYNLGGKPEDVVGEGFGV